MASVKQVVKSKEAAKKWLWWYRLNCLLGEWILTELSTDCLECRNVAELSLVLADLHAG